MLALFKKKIGMEHEGQTEVANETCVLYIKGVNPFVVPADRAFTPTVVDAPSPTQCTRGGVESAGTVEVRVGTNGRADSVHEHSPFLPGRGTLCRSTNELAFRACRGYTLQKKNYDVHT